MFTLLKGSVYDKVYAGEDGTAIETSYVFEEDFYIKLAGCQLDIQEKNKISKFLLETDFIVEHQKIFNFRMI